MPLNLQGFRVAVVGSRDFEDKTRLYEVLDKNKEKIKVIVSGDARGADTLGVTWARDNGVPFLVFPPLWKDPVTGVHDRGAGFRRNRYIVEHSDLVIAFWDGESKGTEHTINMAKDAGKRVIIIKFEKKIVDPSQADFKAPKGSAKISQPQIPNDDPF